MWRSDGADDGPVAVGDVVVLTASNQRLVSFNRATPGTLVGFVAVRGLQEGESLVGMDYRPADRALYALSSAGRIYTLDPATGIAVFRSTLRAASGDDVAGLALVP